MTRGVATVAVHIDSELPEEERGTKMDIYWLDNILGSSFLIFIF